MAHKSARNLPVTKTVVDFRAGNGERFFIPGVCFGSQTRGCSSGIPCDPTTEEMVVLAGTRTHLVTPITTITIVIIHPGQQYGLASILTSENPSLLVNKTDKICWWAPAAMTTI